MKKPVILIKLGGSAITDKTIPYKPREKVIHRLATEFKKADKKYNYILAHGSGSYGHVSAKKYGGNKGYKSKIGIAIVAKDATRINQIFTEIFISEDIPVISIRPMSMTISSSGKLNKHFFEVIDMVMGQGLIPVVYGDIIWDKKWKSTIFSGEKILSEIATYLLEKGNKIEKIIEVGETDGVYDQDGKTIPEINKKNWKIVKKCINNRKGYDVTGGMQHKIESALDFASKYGIETEIVNSNKNDFIDSIRGKNYNATCVKGV